MGEIEEMDLNATLAYIRTRVHSWRETIRGASCEEYMPGALADAISAYDRAVTWLEFTRRHWDYLMEQAVTVEQQRAVSQVINELCTWRFRIEGDLKLKVTEYRQAMLCRNPVGGYQNGGVGSN